MRRILGLLVSAIMAFGMGVAIGVEPAFADGYAHSDSATSGSMTLTVEWNEPRLGEPTVFHVSATGGSGKYKFRMDSPNYSDPGAQAYESVADPSRGEWMSYTDECASHDYEFTMTASGTYNVRFYVMDKASNMLYLRTNTYIQVSDPDHPSVNSIVQNAVTEAKQHTDGSQYAMAVWLHDWLIDRMQYDNSLKWSSAESALTRGLGTCQSYESAYSKLLTAAGIENAETRDTYDGHTWNALKIDGEWMQVDATWDDNDDHWYDFDQRHLYFGLTDELMAIAHKGYANIYQADGYAQRSTSLSNNYFVRNGEADKWASAYADRIQQHLDQAEPSFSITADNASYPPSIYGIVNGITAYALNQKTWKTGNRAVTLTASTDQSAFAFQAEYAEGKPSITIKAASLTLDGAIAVNFKTLIPDEVVSDKGAYALIAFQDGSRQQKIPVADAPAQNGMRVFTYEAYAKEMRDQFTIRFFLSDGTQVDLKNSKGKDLGTSFTYSLDQYLQQAKTSSDQKLKDLMLAMDDYGKYSQIFFKHHDEGLQPSSAIDAVSLETVKPYATRFSGTTPDSIKLVSSRLNLESRTDLILNFALDKGKAASQYSFTVDGQKATPVVNGQTCTIRINGVKSNKLGHMFQITVSDGSTTQVIERSADSYVYDTLKNSTDSGLCNLVRAIYLYNQAAVNYFGE